MATEEKVYLTKEALEAFKKELESLTQVRRPRAVERVAETRVVGEMEESGDYTQAKEDLSFIDGRITELEELLGRAVLIDVDHQKCDTIVLGCRVTVKIDREERVFQLVGEWEADPTSQKISHESPLGQALIGKKLGEKVEIDAP
ncbi:MAG: transcription elongation factor GreA, partial [bacterium]|nr:transcription elongation factor GreA [bacterium]